ncbi:hypothetical protein ACWGOK_27810 [Streptomyces eurythermus]
MRVRRILSAAGTAIAALTLASSLSGTAYAADVYYIRTTGAEGFYWYDDGYTEACDTLADGRRAVIRVRDVTTGGTLGQVADTDGANGLCGHKYLPVPPSGHRVAVDIWRSDGAAGAYENYHSESFVIP